MMVIKDPSQYSKKKVKGIYDRKVRRIVGWICTVCGGVLDRSNADAIIFDNATLPSVIPVHSGKCLKKAFELLHLPPKKTADSKIIDLGHGSSTQLEPI